MVRLIISDLLITALDIVFLFLLLLVVSYYTDPAKVNFLSRWLTDNTNPLLPIGVFFLLFALKNVLGYLISSAQSGFFYDVASRLSKQNIQHYLKDNYLKFISVDSSVQIRKISQQPIEFSTYILTNVQQVITQSIIILLTVGVILSYHPGFFLTLFLVLSPPVVVLGWFIRKKLKAIRANTKITAQKNLQYLNESLSGYIESNVYGKDDFFTDRYFSHQRQLNKNIATQQTLQGLPARLMEVFAVFGLLILIAINKLWSQSPGIDLLNIGVFMAAAYKIIPGIVKILNSTGQIKTYEFTLIDLLPTDTVDSPVGRIAPEIKAVKFEKVCFRYDNKPVLNNLCFELQPGDFAGLSGQSGRGKTTLINLLLGFLDTGEGSISINETKTNTAERQSYWPRISYNKQQPFFINDTIVKNITLSDELYDAAKLVRVITFCGIDKMLPRYPEDIDQKITENGKNISGGQRQRLMLARALYHDFDLLILDEPFSEMDDNAEREILTKLQGLAHMGKMIIFITHNKASLNYCNKIISLDVPQG